MISHKKSAGYQIFTVINTVLLLFIVFITVYPFLYLLAMSLSSSHAVASGKVSFYPIEFTLYPYRQIVSQTQFWIGYRNTIFYTVLGTLIGLFMTTICAYPLAQKNLPGRGVLLKLMVFTMYFSGGLVPSYLLIQKLGWINHVWAIVIPGSISVFNMIIMRTFFMGIPEGLEEAAEIDGLSQIGILVRIVLPLSKAVLATMTLFMAVGQWNEWFQAMIYLNDSKLYPVTLFLRNVVSGAAMASLGDSSTDLEQLTLPQSVESAAIMLVTIPILCIYPFLQKYFVKGVMIGSIKG